jgi:hypothetical protein
MSEEWIRVGCNAASRPCVAVREPGRCDVRLLHRMDADRFVGSTRGTIASAHRATCASTRPGLHKG